MYAALKKILRDQSDLVLVFGVIGILLVLFIPIPTWLLDFLFITNFTFALTLLLLTFYTRKPLEFSTFPSLLLIATLFRLSLNIAATRLILSDANAGKVISAIGTHVVGGNYVIGLIVFLVLIVVQYVVVTSGAQRVAEVAARFTLDSMPGKQLSIDADLNIGIIDEQEAKRRRLEVEREGSFYGAMDGASKFVKGDAIAGIIIILIDIVGGLIIGVAQMGMSWGTSLQTFTLLTVGDGIVTQIPALVIATATGIIVTRAASDDLLSKEIGRQIAAHPKTLILVCGGLMLLLFMPGIPAVPVFLVMMLFGTIAYYSYKRKPADTTAETQAKEATTTDDDLYNQMTVEPIVISIGQNLVPLAGGEDSLFMERIAAFRKQYALDMGLVIPKVRIRDNKKLGPNSYTFEIYGAKVADGELLADRLLAINPGNVQQKLDGIETKDPSYGLPAVWLMPDKRTVARDAGYTVVEPAFVLMTHMGEVIKQQSHNLLTRAETERLVGRVKQSQGGLIEELIPAVMSLSDIQKVLQGLLKERVSIRNIESILEVLVDFGKQAKDPEHLREMVRQKLGATICQGLLDRNGELHVLTLDPRVEKTITTSIRNINERPALILEPRTAELLITRLSDSVDSMMKNNHFPVLLCAPELRGLLRKFVERFLPHLSVVSLSEVPTNISVRAFSMVSV
jgi:flagellar biosynthesis protein FlhA